MFPVREMKSIKVSPTCAFKFIFLYESCRYSSLYTVAPSGACPLLIPLRNAIVNIAFSSCVMDHYDTLQQQKERRLIQADAIGGCLFALEELDLLQITFSEALWNTVIDHVTVYADDRLVFRFKNGMETEVNICK